MKKIILVFLSISFTVVVSGQNLKNSKGTPNDKSKASIQIDTVKNTKSSVVTKEIAIDTAKVEVYKLKPYKTDAHASYYHDKFNGNKTASGVRFDNNKYTAAHKKLPFGTKVKITNIASGKSVIVVITDRGPFVKSREIDLSKRAFMEIAKNKGIGVMTVNIEIVEEN